MPCTFLWDMTLRTNLGKSLETPLWYLECSSLLQFMAQEFPKTRVIHVFLHEMICTDMCLWYVSCFKKLYSSVLVCVKNQLLLFSTCRLVVSFYDLLRTRNSERHWIIIFFPISCLLSNCIVYIQSCTSSSLGCSVITQCFLDFLPSPEFFLSVVGLLKVSWDKRIKIAQTSYIFHIAT